MGALRPLGALNRLKTSYQISPVCAQVREDNHGLRKAVPSSLWRHDSTNDQSSPCTGSLTVHPHYHMGRAHSTFETAFDPHIIKTNQPMIALAIQ